MKPVGRIIHKYRKKAHLTQQQLADRLNADGINLSYRAVSSWEQGVAEPSVTTFMHICRVLEIPDFYEEYFGSNPFNPLSVLNDEGKAMVGRYIDQLTHPVVYLKGTAPQETGTEEMPAAGRMDADSNIRYGTAIPDIASHGSDSDDTVTGDKVFNYFSYAGNHPQLPKFTLRPSAGTGEILDSNDYQLMDVPPDIADTADFMLEIHGDSMMPEYRDGQTVYIRKQNYLESGEIGIFYLEGMAYIKKYRNDAGGTFLVSLNRKYAPIPVTAADLENDDFRIFGKVVGAD